MERQPNTIEAQATRWAIRLDAGPLSAAEQAELDTWIASDRRRHGALVRARAAWLAADRLAALAGASPPLSRTVTLRMRFLAAASVAAIALAALWYGDSLSGETYASEIGQVRKIALTDGSELTLNTNTRTRVRFRDDERDIALQEGEALFKVAHDPSRPFVVRANDVRVRAVGTAFTVRVDDERVDVTVTEGVVEVWRDGSAVSVQRVNANHRVVIGSSGSRLAVEPIDPQLLSRQLAWRVGMLVFAGEPLSVAATEINRHSRNRLYVDDPDLAAQPVVGIFRANDADAFASAAAATFDAEIVRTDEAIHLRVVPARAP